MRGAVSPCCEVHADDEIERHKLLERQKQHLLFPVPLEVLGDFNISGGIFCVCLRAKVAGSYSTTFAL
jgi:hypothetical protein